MKAAKWFLEEMLRRNRDVTVSNESSERQNYFKGVFVLPEAKISTDFDQMNTLTPITMKNNLIFKFT